MMRRHRPHVLGWVCSCAFLFSPAVWSAQAQPPAYSTGGARDPAGRASLPVTEDNRQFDPRNLSGVWRGSLYGFGMRVPAFTAEGQKRFAANKPSYGIALNDPTATTRTDVHIGRRRAVAPAFNNDPTQRCNPLGLIRLIVYAPAPMEIIQLPNRIIQTFEWTWDHRDVWMDGRPLPDVEEYLPRWNGYSVGRWEGDTFVVETVGLDERQWIDHFGYPLSSGARLVERWRRVNYSNLEVHMTLTDPVLYATPWEGDVARFRLVESKGGAEVWNTFVEDKCVPLDSDPFYEQVVEPVSGVK